MGTRALTSDSRGMTATCWTSPCASVHAIRRRAIIVSPPLGNVAPFVPFSRILVVCTVPLAHEGYEVGRNMDVPGEPLLNRMSDLVFSVLMFYCECFTFLFMLAWFT